MKVGIIGSGAYAIALASLLENKDIDLLMWCALEDEYQELSTRSKNSKAVNYKLNAKVKFTMDMKEIVTSANCLIIAIPAKFIKNTTMLMKPFITNQKILIATKGLEENTRKLLHDYLKDELKTDDIACISGPSFAIDVIEKEPIGLTIASLNDETLTYFANLFNDINYLTIETVKDIVGCELCGVLKNIMAIFSGILDGINVTYSTNAKFLVDASYEIQNIIHLFGGNKKTFNTYAGLGDLILTCTSIKSRNYTFGKLIGEQKDFKNYLKTTTVEGLENLDTIYFLLKERNIYSEIVEILYKIVYENENISLIFKYLNKKN